MGGAGRPRQIATSAERVTMAAGRAMTAFAAAFIFSLFLVQNGRCNVLFKRAVSSDHANYGLYNQMAQVPGSVSLGRCAAMALDTWDSDLTTPAANAFRHRKATGACDYGTIPNTEFADMVGQDPTEDDDGIYVNEKCLEPMVKHLDAYILAPMVEGKEDKYFDSEKTERTLTNYDESIQAACTAVHLGAVTFAQRRALRGTCHLIKGVIMEPLGSPFTDVTLMAWVYVTSSVATNDPIAMLSRAGSWESGFWLKLDGGAADLHVWEGFEVQEFVADGPAIPENVWTHIAATYTHAAGTVRFYLNVDKFGADVNIGTVALNDPLDTVGLNGCASTGSCSLAHVGIYKAALDAGDIKDLYETSRPDRTDCPLI